ncbi:MAG: FHA domain-containing protein [Anaerolineales bacterium]
MNGFSGKLDQIETRLQSFIEGKLSRLSPIRGGSDEVSRQLVSAMQAGMISSDDGTLLAPDQFTLLAHPSQANILSDDPEVLADLANLIQEVGRAAGYHFRQHPVINISPNEDVPTDRIDIIARISANAMGHTATLNGAPKIFDTVNPKAFLILNGMDIFPLDKTVINIGRRSNNHLTIDDPRVSRQHAQIRVLNGRFEIFDLDSTGGTFINQKRIKQSLLRSGDVISLAGVNLIYGQETSPSSVVETKKLNTSENINRLSQ